MKKTLLFITSLLILNSLSAAINYTNYDDGWVIPMGANEAIDIDGNGTDDFYVNGIAGELGFVPIYGVGCFSSPSETAYTSFGARELSRHQLGDLIQLNSLNLYDFIDDGRGSGYSVSGGFADGWVDMEDVYIGFVVIVNGDSQSGWMRIVLDETNETLIIKELAYEDPQPIDSGGILVGDKETTAVNNLSEDFGKVTIAPNPANDFFQIDFDYVGKKELSIVIQNGVGQEVYRSAANFTLGKSTINLSTSNWSTGVYFIRFETTDGVRVEKLNIAK